MSGRPKVVVLGMMTNMPVAGVVWQTLHYLVGLRRLGYEPYYVEAHARNPSMFMMTPTDDGSGRAAAFIDDLTRRFGLEGQWAYQALHEDRRCYGLSDEALSRLYRDAALVINLHGGTIPLPEHIAHERLVYVETDPVQVQVELLDGVREAIEFLAAHSVLLSYGENLGNPDCALPIADGYHFIPTRQPVVLEWWSGMGEIGGTTFRTVGSWRQRREVDFAGEQYSWSKHAEFEKFLDLPARTGQAFELALASFDDDDRELLESHGWSVVNGLDLSRDLDAYRRYIADARGEWTVAKDQNVRLRTGWFSDRGATFLASGRPVVTQDTGFGAVLPTGAGLFAVSTLDEAVDAVDRINRDYPAACRAAADIAREYFDSDRVLGRLLEDAGLPALAPDANAFPELPAAL
jgi:hypothetical protein